MRYSHNHLWSSEPHISEDNLGLLGLLGQRVLLPEELPLLLRHMAGNVSCLYARWVQMEAGILLHWPGNITSSAPPPPASNRTSHPVHLPTATPLPIRAPLRSPLPEGQDVVESICIQLCYVDLITNIVDPGHILRRLSLALLPTPHCLRGTGIGGTVDPDKCCLGPMSSVALTTVNDLHLQGRDWGWVATAVLGRTELRTLHPPHPSVHHVQEFCSREILLL